MERVIADKIAAAYRMRLDCGVARGNGDGATTVYRLVNSEGDGLSGVCVDVYENSAEESGKVAVAAVSAAWAHMRRDAVVKALGEHAGIDTVLWRTDARMLKLEGVYEESGEESDDDSGDESGEESGDESASSQSEGARCYDAKTGAETAAPTGWVTVIENGVKYEVDLTKGHKTGFYVDQRDNRKVMREIARGKRVLDVCCYTGGFALNAALGGASDVVAVDSSESALDMARKNAELNGVQDKVNFVRADAFDFMQAEIDAGRAGSYDVVVLDPPKFAPTKPALKKAIPKYVGLNKRAMTLLRPGGILITCSCSGAVTQERLLPKIVENASRASGVSATMLSIRGAGCDQPIDPAYAFGEYLSVVTARIA